MAEPEGRASVHLFGFLCDCVQDTLQLRQSYTSSVPQTPARCFQVALAFVYQNVVPVISTSLEGDVKKIRTAVAIGLAIPLLMFVGWEGAILGCIGPGAPPAAP